MELHESFRNSCLFRNSVSILKSYESQQDVTLLSLCLWNNDNSDLYGLKLITVIIMQDESNARALSVGS